MSQLSHVFVILPIHNSAAALSMVFHDDDHDHSDNAICLRQLTWLAYTAIGQVSRAQRFCLTVGQTCAGIKNVALLGRPHFDADEHELEGLPSLESGDSRHQWGGLQSSQELQVGMPCHIALYCAVLCWIDCLVTVAKQLSNKDVSVVYILITLPCM